MHALHIMLKRLFLWTFIDNAKSKDDEGTLTCIFIVHQKTRSVI